MLSKREKLFAAVSDLHGLICPVCRRLLSRQGDNLICAGGHAINVNRRGCVNLLSAQADTFYDAVLFAARERVFAAGCYQPVADAIDALLPDAPQKAGGANPPRTRRLGRADWLLAESRPG